MTPKSSIDWLDWVVMALYFAGMAWIGWHFSRQSKTTDGYFLGGGKIPTWAIGLSMPSISSITFLAFPAAAYALDWRHSINIFTYPLAALLAVWVFVPFFRERAKTSAYEYLQYRFGTSARLYGAIAFLFAQGVRLGSMLYLMTLPLTMFTDLHPLTIMFFVGAFTGAYTIFGGISAVVWTDVVQTFMLLIGGIAAVVIMIIGAPGGLGQLMEVSMANDKFGMGPMSFNPDERTFWAMFIVGMSHGIYTYSSDQTMVQRYLAAATKKEAQKATLISAFVGVPTWVLFTFIGTFLFAYYQILPDPEVAALSADKVFPHFIINAMPAGATGLVLAGLLAAAMSALSTSLNSFSTVLTVDIVRPYLWKNRTDAQYATFGRNTTLVVSVLMIGIGFLFYGTEKESFKDLMLRLSSIFGGVLLAMFLLAFFVPKLSRRMLWISFWVATVLNVVLLCIEWKVLPNPLPFKFHIYWITILVNGGMFVCGLVLSWIWPAEPKNDGTGPALPVGAKAGTT